MRFSYEKLWHLLLDKHMTRKHIRTKCGISSNSIAKLGKGQNITTDILLKICKELDCDIKDIMGIVRDQYKTFIKDKETFIMAKTFSDAERHILSLFNVGATFTYPIHSYGRTLWRYQGERKLLYV